MINDKTQMTNDQFTLLNNFTFSKIPAKQDLTGSKSQYPMSKHLNFGPACRQAGFDIDLTFGF
ncbi:hypothetical protein HZA71_02425 [Candidatus Falkowbacteria bacterium]|nr:hypothetical protein [Candidatus Falkowbacteria bacterium]